jgi:hypothetical protein
MVSYLLAVSWNMGVPLRAGFYSCPKCSVHQFPSLFKKSHIHPNFKYIHLSSLLHFSKQEQSVCSFVELGEVQVETIPFSIILRVGSIVPHTSFGFLTTSY